MITFDMETFQAFTGLRLAEYVAEVKSSEYAGLDRELLERLLDRVHSHDEEHAMYLVLWGIRFQIGSISDIAVAFLERDAAWHGAQAAVLTALCDAQDLTAQHVRRIQPRPRRTSLGATFPDVFPELIEDLRRHAAERARKGKGVDSANQGG